MLISGNPINMYDVLGLAGQATYVGSLAADIFGSRGTEGDWKSPFLNSPVPIGGSGTYETGATFEETNCWEEIEKFQTVEEIVEYLMNNTKVEEGADFAISHINFKYGFSFFNLQVSIPESNKEALARGDDFFGVVPVGIGFYIGGAASTGFHGTTHNGELGFLLILAGKDAGQVVVQTDYGFGLSGPTADVSIEVQFYFLEEAYKNSHLKLEAANFEGERYEGGVSFLGTGITGMRSVPMDVGTIWAVGPEFSSGLSSIKFDINFNYGSTWNNYNLGNIFP